MFLVFIGLLGSTNTSFAVTHTIQVASFSFTPSSIPNVALGDVIRWEWVDGFHTTTSGVIPAGAAPWDEFIYSGSTFFEYTPTVAGVYNYVCTPHVGLGMIGSFTVLGGGGGGPTPTKIVVETAADGSGTVVPAQTLSSGTPLTVYAISRDASNAFISNTSASWILQNASGGVVSGDLSVASDGKSATFTAHVIGATLIKATSAALTPTTSGVVTVVAGTANKVRVETAANGSGAVVPLQSIASGSSITGYAITRDASNNFVANVAATSWTLVSTAGGIVASDLVASADNKSATFTGHVSGFAAFKATSGALTATPSGQITVTAGTPTIIKVETAGNGTGSVVPAQSLASGSSITVFAISRDASNNFVANVAASSWTLENITDGVSVGDLSPSADSKSASFTAHIIGTTNIKATSGSLTPISSGLITIIAGTANKVRVETATDGTGSLVSAQTLASGVSLTAYAITRDTYNNFIANVAATTWTLENITGGVVAGDLVAAADYKSATFTGHIIGAADFTATSLALPATPSGLINVTAGNAAKVNVETAANGSGSILPAQTVISGSSITGYSITRDALNNFVANVAATAWSLENISGSIAAGNLVPASDAKSAIFTGTLGGTANIKATSGALTTTASGLITVTVPSASIQGTISYKNNVNTPITNSTVQLIQNGVVVNTATTNIAGQYSFANVSNGTYTIACVITKAWGGVNSADALLISKSFVGIAPLSGLNKKTADVNNSGTINSLDPLIAMRRFVGVISSFNVGDWQIETNTITISNPVTTTLNLKVLCTGDVDGSFVPSTF